MHLKNGIQNKKETNYKKRKYSLIKGKLIQKIYNFYIKIDIYHSQNSISPGTSLKNLEKNKLNFPAFYFFIIKAFSPCSIFFTL